MHFKARPSTQKTKFLNLIKLYSELENLREKESVNALKPQKLS